MSLTSKISNETAIVAFNANSVLLEEQEEQLKNIIESVQALSKTNFSKMAIPVITNCLRNFKQQSYPKSALQLLAVTFYLNLLGLGALTLGSSGVLLSYGNYTDALSVDFANDITNAAALLCVLTDLPPITFGLYYFIVKKRL